MALSYSEQVAQRLVSRWETGTRPVPRKHLVELARLLKLEVEELL